MRTYYSAHRARTWGQLAALALLLVTPVASSAVAQMSASEETAQTVLDKLPASERNALADGQVTVTAKRSGDNGQFTARVLIDAPLAETWQVLTDYDNFEQFLPNVENSQLLESEDNRRVFEQLNVVSVIPEVVDIRSRIVVEVMESYPEQVDFNLVEGDLEELQGVWQLEPVVTTDDSQPEQILITHEVDINPGDSSPRGLFFSTYRVVLEDSMIAAKAEAERRAAQ